MELLVSIWLVSTIIWILFSVSWIMVQGLISKMLGGSTIVIKNMKVKCWSLRCTALHNAAGKGHLDIVKLIVGSGADINIRLQVSDCRTQTLLHDLGLIELRHL